MHERDTDLAGRQRTQRDGRPFLFSVCRGCAVGVPVDAKAGRSWRQGGVAKATRTARDRAAMAVRPAVSVTCRSQREIEERPIANAAGFHQVALLSSQTPTNAPPMPSAPLANGFDNLCRFARPDANQTISTTSPHRLFHVYPRYSGIGNEDCIATVSGGCVTLPSRP
jgi:hypothetical protein